MKQPIPLTTKEDELWSRIVNSKLDLHRHNLSDSVYYTLANETLSDNDVTVLQQLIDKKMIVVDYKSPQNFMFTKAWTILHIDIPVIIETSDDSEEGTQ